MVNFKSIQNQWNFKQSITKIKDTKNFEIDKTGRFAARFFQIMLALLNFYWVGRQGKLAENLKMQDIHAASIAFAVISPICSGFLVLIYVFPWFSKKWTSRRMLSLETFIDVFMALTWIGLFGAWLQRVGTSCVTFTNVTTDECVPFNWFVAWMFFLFVSWSTGVVFDCTAWYKGVFKQQEIESDVLLDIRRTTRHR